MEKDCLKWLQERVNNKEIAICEADKGGCILIVKPEYLVEKVKEKVTDTDLYVETDDKRHVFYDDLFNLWKVGKSKEYVSEQEAKAIVGITAENNKSTASRFKYGRTYYVPSLKIHKLPPEELLPGANIPARLITCLQEGVTKRSDVFIADRWLKDLERDYCSDLVKDTTESLVWLDDKIDKLDISLKRKARPFTFDFAALYDSLNPKWVSEALQEAMHCCRPSWSKDFKNWILGLIQLSIDSSIGEFNGKFYKQKKGLPTGGSLIVEIANITVFFILNCVLYNDKTLMRDVADIKRYIDDGIGVHYMTPRAFGVWKKWLVPKLKIMT